MSCVDFEVLDMSLNSIAELSEEIGMLCMLRVFDMSSNILAELPEELGMLRMLQVLDMSDNRLRRLPVSLWSVDSLRELRIAGNPLDSVDEASMVKRTRLRLLWFFQSTCCRYLTLPRCRRCHN